MNPDSHIILFDGVCNLCNGFVQRIINADKNNDFKFAALQSTTGQELLKNAGIDGKTLNTVVYLKNGVAYIKSTAALNVFKQLGYPYKLLFFVGIIFPKFIRDFVYNVISKNRYKWFGKQESCMIPTPALKAKFLND